MITHLVAFVLGAICMWLFKQYGLKAIWAWIASLLGTMGIAAPGWLTNLFGG